MELMYEVKWGHGDLQEGARTIVGEVSLWELLDADLLVNEQLKLKDEGRVELQEDEWYELRCLTVAL